jgi:hypothetical protein
MLLSDKQIKNVGVFIERVWLYFMGKSNQSTFIVRISQKENATWQGQVTWADENITRNFRSALELIKMMDEASQTQQDADELAG